MSPSRPFILRPVATSLLMAAILLAGFVAYRQLPVSALPEVDYPIIQVVTFYPGASPDVMASSVTAPLERAVRAGAGPEPDDLHQFPGRIGHHAAIQPRLRTSTLPSRKCRPAINARADFPAQRICRILPSTARSIPPIAPILTLALSSTDHAAAEGRGSRRHHAGAEDFPVARRRPG